MESEDFSKYIGEIYGHGTVMMAMALGYDLGLFKLLCEAECPLSAVDIAEKTGLKERYTREWLSSMVASKIIHLDRDTGLYIIPESHKGGLRMSSSFATALFLLSDKRHDVKSCFSKEGPYGLYQAWLGNGRNSYVNVYDHVVLTITTSTETSRIHPIQSIDVWPEFFNWLDGYRSGSVDHILDEEVIPKLAENGIVAKLEAGIKVVDLGCGTGNLIIGLAKRFPKTTFTGLDYSDTALTIARERATSNGVENVSFEFGDAHNLPDSIAGYFDLGFVYNVLHDLPDPHQALTQVHKILKEDGCFIAVEVNVHSNPCDNVGNQSAARYYAMGMFTCLPSSMNEEKHIGYGACWGREEIEKALLGAGFKIKDHASSIIVTGPKVFYFCSK